MIRQGSILLEHTSFATGEKYYDQAGMMEAKETVRQRLAGAECRLITGTCSGTK